MQAALQYPLLEELGYAITASLVQMFSLWILIVLLFKAFNIKPSVKYLIGILIQFAGLVWFILTICQYNPLISGGEIDGPLFSVSLMGLLYQSAAKINYLMPCLALLYLLILPVFLARWILVYFQTLKLGRNYTSNIEEHWKHFTNRIAAQLSIPFPIQICVSDLVKSPLTIGFFKPFILIPVASINSLTVTQLEAVILHELAHIKRYDYAINICMSIIQSVLFFNPFTYLINEHIKRERENSCDDLVMQFHYDPLQYSEALLQIACQAAGNNNYTFLSMQVTGKNNQLLKRIKRLLQQENRSTHTIIRKGLFILLSITVLTWLLSVKGIPGTGYVQNQAGQLSSQPILLNRYFIQQEPSVIFPLRKDHTISARLQDHFVYEKNTVRVIVVHAHPGNQQVYHQPVIEPVRTLTITDQVYPNTGYQADNNRSASFIPDTAIVSMVSEPVFSFAGPYSETTQDHQAGLQLLKQSLYLKDKKSDLTLLDYTNIGEPFHKTIEAYYPNSSNKSNYQFTWLLPGKSMAIQDPESNELCVFTLIGESDNDQAPCYLFRSAIHKNGTVINHYFVVLKNEVTSQNLHAKYSGLQQLLINQNQDTTTQIRIQQNPQ